MDSNHGIDGFEDDEFDSNGFPILRLDAMTETESNDTVSSQHSPRSMDTMSAMDDSDDTESIDESDSDAFVDGPSDAELLQIRQRVIMRTFIRLWVDNHRRETGPPALVVST